MPNMPVLKTFFQKYLRKRKTRVYLPTQNNNKIFFLMEMTTTQLIEKAAQLANNPSAIFCANQAAQMSAIERSAKMWALKSIAHSVGIFHPIYIANDWQ